MDRAIISDALCEFGEFVLVRGGSIVKKTRGPTEENGLADVSVQWHCRGNRKHFEFVDNRVFLLAMTADVTAVLFTRNDKRQRTAKENNGTAVSVDIFFAVLDW